MAVYFRDGGKESLSGWILTELTREKGRDRQTKAEMKEYSLRSPKRQKEAKEEKPRALSKRRDGGPRRCGSV